MTAAATAPPRPTWQTAPCPAWCTSVHAEGDDPADRHCLSGEHTTRLSLADPIVVVDQSGPAWAQPSLRAGLEKAPDGAARVVVTRYAEARYDELTLPEAEAYARQILALVATARVEGSAS